MLRWVNSNSAFNLGLSEWVIWRSNYNILLSLAFTLLNSLVKQWVKSKKSKNLIAQPWMEYEAYQLSTLYYFIPSITAPLISIFMDRFTCPCFSFSLDFAWPLDMARPNMMAMRYVVDPAPKSVVDVVVAKLKQMKMRRSSTPRIFWLVDDQRSSVIKRRFETTLISFIQISLLYMQVRYDREGCD